MNKFKTIGITAIAIMLLINHVKAQLPSTDPAFQLVWQDTFKTWQGYKIDTSKWLQLAFGTQNDSADSTWLQSCKCNKIRDVAYQKWYLPVSNPPLVPSFWPPDTTNCQVTGNQLNLYARKETGYFNGVCWNWLSCPATPTPCNVSPYTCSGSPSTCWNSRYRKFKWTASAVISKYKFRYGYFEIQFMLPGAAPTGKHYVTGPHFWMFAGNTEMNPPYKTSEIYWSEIDIFEMIAHNNNFTTNLHYLHYPDSIPYVYGNQLDTIGTISGNVWHTAGCLWTSNEIVKFLDGVPVATLTNPDIKPDSLVPMPLILDLGGPDVGDSLSDPNAVFPYQYQVKYVKVWQLKPRCSNPSIDTTIYRYSASAYKNALYNSITMGNDTINNTSYQSFWASDHISINAGTTINGSGNVLFDMTDCVSTMQSYKFVPQPPPASYLQRLSRHSYQ